MYKHGSSDSSRRQLQSTSILNLSESNGSVWALPKSVNPSSEENSLPVTPHTQRPAYSRLQGYESDTSSSTYENRTMNRTYLRVTNPDQETAEPIVAQTKPENLPYTENYQENLPYTENYQENLPYTENYQEKQQVQLLYTHNENDTEVVPICLVTQLAPSNTLETRQQIPDILISTNPIPNKLTYVDPLLSKDVKPNELYIQQSHHVNDLLCEDKKDKERNKQITNNGQKFITESKPINLAQDVTPSGPTLEHTRPSSPTLTQKPHPTNQSKYARVSYHLSHNPSALKQYRSAAEKNKNPETQLAFAKYLLEMANAFYGAHEPDRPPEQVGSIWHAKRPIDQVSDGSSHTTSLVNQPSVGTQPIRTVNQQNLTKRKALEEEAVRWIRKLGKQEDPEACYMLASWIDQELYGFKQNRSRSIELHQVAARQGVPESIYAVADYYDKEGGKEQDWILKQYKLSANLGYVNAVHTLSLITFKGRLGERQSLTEGLKLMHKACSLSTKEFSVPLYDFAQMLTNEYKEIDLPEVLVALYGGKEASVSYYKRASELNNSLAQARLGSIYEHGLCGESMDFAKALEYYQIAAMGNNPKAMLGLSRLNNLGSHGPGDKNLDERLINDKSGWLKTAAINEDASFSWCERAAGLGLPDALALLGWYYEIGFGVPRDFEKASEYYKLAAQKGDTSAKSRLTNTNKSITKQQHEVNARLISKQGISTKNNNLNQKDKNKCFCM